jgi:hypothetical protein
MTEPNRAYRVSLWYEGYFGKSMDVEAASLLEACRFAMERADDDGCWTDTLCSSSHWIACVDDGAVPVPEDFSAAAIRCGGAVLIANRLRDTLFSLVQACETNRGSREEIDSHIERARALLQALPDRIEVD